MFVSMLPKSRVFPGFFALSWHFSSKHSILTTQPRGCCLFVFCRAIGRCSCVLQLFGIAHVGHVCRHLIWCAYWTGATSVREFRDSAPTPPPCHRDAACTLSMKSAPSLPATGGVYGGCLTTDKTQGDGRPSQADVLATSWGL